MAVRLFGETHRWLDKVMRALQVGHGLYDDRAGCLSNLTSSEVVLQKLSKRDVMKIVEKINSFTIVLFALFLSFAGAAYSQQAAPTKATSSDAEARCAALKDADFSQLIDAPTKVDRTEIIRVYPDLPETCQVHGTIDKTVGFAVAMPLENWNGRFYQTGCGGGCGQTKLYFCDQPLKLHSACLGTDLGHKGEVGDWTWASGPENLQKVVNFGFRATHMAAVAGKAVVEAYYKSAPKHAYFFGCSTGGRQALMEAEQFPWDFDGIIAGSPAMDETNTAVQLLWTVLANRDKDGHEIIDAKDLNLLHEAVMNKCDGIDGLKDGLIGDPRLCKFDPVVLKCSSATATQCLTQVKIDAIRKIYSGPHTSDGRPLFTGGLMPGSELTWLGAYVSKEGKSPLYWGFMSGFWRNVGFSTPPGPDWQPNQFDFDRDPKRLGMMEPLFNSANPDLRKFKERGGKMIGFDGWDDNSVVPLKYLDYYQTVIRAMGGLDKTQDFYRFFMVPGMRHCSSDGVGADNINYVEYIENWVEKGQAPDMMLGHHVVRTSPPTRSIMFPLDPKTVDFTRPHFAYPAQYRYKGSGDPHDAANFKKVIVHEPL